MKKNLANVIVFFLFLSLVSCNNIGDDVAKQKSLEKRMNDSYDNDSFPQAKQLLDELIALDSSNGEWFLSEAFVINKWF